MVSYTDSESREGRGVIRSQFDQVLLQVSCLYDTPTAGDVVKTIVLY